MALVTRRYRYNTASAPVLQGLVAPSAAVVSQYVNAVDLQVDNAAGTPETLDEYMATLGYVYDPAAPASGPSLAGVGRWMFQMTIGANVTQPMPILAPSFIDCIMPRNGYLLAMTSYTSADIALGGSVTFQPRKGSPTTVLAAPNNIAGSQWIMNAATWPRERRVAYTPGLYTFLGNDKIGIEINTNASAGANSYIVVMEVAYTA